MNAGLHLGGLGHAALLVYAWSGSPGVDAVVAAQVLAAFPTFS